MLPSAQNEVRLSAETHLSSLRPPGADVKPLLKPVRLRLMPAAAGYLPLSQLLEIVGKSQPACCIN